MIHINIKQTDQFIHSIELTGHAGYADAGYDIVCAAVSSQVISIENSLDQLLKIPLDVDVNEVEGGYLKITLPDLETIEEETMADAQLLMRHLVLALSVIRNQYPEYINIKIN